MPRTRFSPLFSSADSISIHTFTQTTMRHEPFQPHCVWMCFLYAHVDNFEILKQTERKWIFFLRFPSHSCLNKNNFVMISICKKNTQTKSHQSNGTMKSYGFRTRLEWKTLNKTSQPTRAHTHTKERKTNQLSRLFFSLPKTQVQFVCTKSLAEEHLYVELWLNFIIQTIYFNVGGGDGAVIFSFWCFSSSSSSSSFSFFINKSEQKKHSLASLLSVQQQHTVEWSELGAANCSQKALSVCDLNIFALRYTKT